MDEEKFVEEFIARLHKLKGHNILYRGLADSNWEVEAAASRRIKGDNARVDLVGFRECIKDLLNRARVHGHGYRGGRGMSDLELLAELQHHGAATCLIDFTTDPLIALWFACEGKPEEDGVVVAMSTDEVSDFSEVSSEGVGSKEIESFIRGETIWKWGPIYINKRASSQRSVFIFGEPRIDKGYYETIGVSKEHKESIINILRDKYGIAEDVLFLDLPGFALSNAHDKPYKLPDAERYLNLGEKVHQKGDFKGAVGYYDKAIKLRPDLADAYSNRGIAKNFLGNLQGAVEDFNKAIEIRPDLAVAYYNRGNAKMDLGDLQGAIEDFNEAIEIRPDLAVAYYNRGNAKKALEDLQGAIEDFNEAIEIRPNLASAYNNRGNAKKALGDLQGAIEDFSKAIEIRPNLASAYNNRGLAKKALGDLQGAIEDFNKAIEIRPDLASAYNNRGNAKKALGDLQGALEDLNKAIEIRPDLASVYKNRGIVKEGLGDKQGAKEDYDKAKAIIEQATVIKR